MSERAADSRALTSSSTLEERAPGLARAHQPLNRARPRGAELVDPRALSRSIERATREFRNPKPEDTVYQKAAEWLLDNHFLVARAVRQVGSELPKGFRRRLPHVGADDLPRVLRISHALVEATSLDFDEAALLGFVAAYQRQAPLRIAELWALPTMLRISVLEALVQMLDVFFPPTLVKRSTNMVVDEIMTRQPFAVLVTESVEAVMRKLQEADVRHLPVIDEGQLVGLVSDRDLRAFTPSALLEFERPGEIAERLARPISDAMSPDVISVNPETDVVEVIDLMIEQNIGAIPVVEADSSKLVGIVSYVDALRAARDLL